MFLNHILKVWTTHVAILLHYVYEAKIMRWSYCLIFMHFIFPVFPTIVDIFITMVES